MLFLMTKDSVQGISMARIYISLNKLQASYKKVSKNIKRDTRYDGLEQCRKNVRKCNLIRKLAYCY